MVNPLALLACDVQEMLSCRLQWSCQGALVDQFPSYLGFLGINCHLYAIRIRCMLITSPKAQTLLRGVVLPCDQQVITMCHNSTQQSLYAQITNRYSIQSRVKQLFANNLASLCFCKDYNSLFKQLYVCGSCGTPLSTLHVMLITECHDSHKHSLSLLTVHHQTR